MIFNPYGYLGMHSPRAGKSYIRILHASPNAPGVDVYADGTMIAQDLKYREFTEYLKIPAGEYRIRVFPSGSTQNPVIDTDFNLPGGKIYTVAAAGLLPDISLFPVEDPVMPKSPDKAYVRFVHLSPNAPNVDITLPDGTILFGDVGYKQITNYIPVPPATYTLEARVAGTKDIVLYVPNIKLTADRFYTIYAVGLAGQEPPLQVLIPLDGNSYIVP